MTKKTITFELNGYEVDRMRKAINAIKDFNRTTDEKADISYDVIQNLDCVDLFLGRLIGLGDVGGDVKGSVEGNISHGWMREETSND